MLPLQLSMVFDQTWGMYPHFSTKAAKLALIAAGDEFARCAERAGTRTSVHKNDNAIQPNLQSIKHMHIKKILDSEY